MIKLSSAAIDDLEQLLTEKLKHQQLAAMQAYINPRKVEDLFGLNNMLQVDRPDPSSVMMTTSPQERAMLSAQLNGEVQGLGANQLIIEQYARYKSLRNLLAIRDAQTAKAIDANLTATLNALDNMALTTRKGTAL